MSRSFANSSTNLPCALYVVATPLGNLADISSRAQQTLAAVTLIAAEDTRHSRRLLDALQINTAMMALHEHNEQEAAGKLIQHLQSGHAVALISDAGTPAICDPGARAVARIRAAGFEAIAIPGPCAAIAALSVAGWLEPKFDFVGFLPPKSAARKAAIAELATRAPTQVLYESPHRIASCIADLADLIEATRPLVIARELTKLHEETAVLTLAEAPAWLAASAHRSKGEFVLLLGGNPQALTPQAAQAQHIVSLLADELPPNQAARLAAKITGVDKKTLYAQLVRDKT